jgi:hypothetical protein
MKNVEMKEKLKNVTRVQKKKVMRMPTPADGNYSQQEAQEAEKVVDTVEELEERLEEN